MNRSSDCAQQVLPVFKESEIVENVQCNISPVEYEKPLKKEQAAVALDLEVESDCIRTDVSTQSGLV